MDRHAGSRSFGKGGWSHASALVAGVLALAASAAAQSQKLNGSLLRSYRGDIDPVGISPDGGRIVYEGYSEAGESGFYSASTKRGHPLRLDAALPRNSQYERISPDGRYFVYVYQGLHRAPLDGSRGSVQLAPRADNFRFTTAGRGVVFSADGALFHVSLDGSKAPLRLTAPFVAGGSISTFEVGGGSRAATERVCYLADAETDGVNEVFSVPIDASAPPVKLNGPFASFSDAWFLAFSPAGGRVVFLADSLTDGVDALHSAPLDGSGAAVVLSQARIRNSGFVRISPDGRWVVFLAELGPLNRFDLFAVPIDGSAPAVRLNSALPAGGSVAQFDVAPGSDRVVYLADQDVNDDSELFTVAIDGSSPPVEIDHELEPGEDVVTLSVSGPLVVYRTYLSPQRTASLHSVPVAGGAAPVELSGEESVSSFLVSPDGARVAFFAFEPLLGTTRGLFSVPIDGGDPVLLDVVGKIPVGITADGERVLYRSDRDVPGVFELFSVSIRGGRSPVPLNHSLGALEVADVSNFQIGPDGERCLFVVRAETCDCDDSGSFELHEAGIDPLSPSRWIVDDIGQAVFTRDGVWAVFQEGIDDGEDFGSLFSIRVGGALEPLELEVNAGSFALLPDDRTVVFSKDAPMAGVYRRPIDGSAPASPLALGAVERLSLSPDGSRVVYTKRDGQAFELFSVLVDGTGAPVQLNDVTSPRGSPWYPFGITPDGARVFYWTDQLVDGVFELFSVPSDGSAGPTKLSGTLVPGGDVDPFAGVAVTPDGTRLVYRADALVDGVQDLFSVRVDGSGAPVRLNATLPPLGWIREFALLPDGSRVIYRAEQTADEVYELFSAPIDASAPPVRLNAPLVAGGDVSVFSSTARPAFTISPDGSRVVYAADQRTDGVFELFSTTPDGSGTPVALGGPSIAEGDVRDAFQITADGAHVIYAADHDRDEVVELYGAPIRGGKATRLNAHLVAGGDVEVNVPPRITPDGKWLLYVADQDTDTVNELYRVPLSLPRSSAGSAPSSPRRPHVR